MIQACAPQTMVSRPLGEAALVSAPSSPRQRSTARQPLQMNTETTRSLTVSISRIAPRLGIKTMFHLRVSSAASIRASKKVEVRIRLTKGRRTWSSCKVQIIARARGRTRALVSHISRMSQDQVRKVRKTVGPARLEEAHVKRNSEAASTL